MLKCIDVSKEIEISIFHDGMEDGWLLCLFSFSEWSVPMRDFFNSRNAAEEAETVLLSKSVLKYS